MTAYLLSTIPVRELDVPGNPIPGAKLYTKVAGTATPLATYTDSTAGTPLPNPIVADPGGHYPEIWISSAAYDLEARKADGTTVLWQRTNVQAPQVVSDALRAELAVPTTGPDLIGYKQDAPAVAVRTTRARLKDRWHIKDFLAIGDGSTWHQAMQRAADSKERVDFDPVTYNIGAEVNPQSGARLYGAGSYTGAASTHSTDGVTTLNWVGSGGTNTAMVRISNAAVGVLPVSAADANMQNVTFSGFVLQGNGIPDIGIYGTRCTQGNNLDFITVVGSLKHAFWMGQCFGGGGLRSWMAYKNRGVSFSLGMGDTDFGWASDTFEQCVLESPFAYFGGCDSSGNPLNVFNDAGSGAVNAGYRIGGGRGLQITNLQAAQCDGPGVYLKPRFAPILISGGYVEFCARSSSSTQQWATWYDGHSSGFNAYLKWQSLRFGGTAAHKMTGTRPSRREGGPLFENCPLIGSVDAAWDNYRLIDCDRSVAYIGGAVRPTNFDRMRSTDSSLTMSGNLRFTTSAGAVSGVRKYGSLAGNITRTSAGLFVANSTETYTNGFSIYAGTLPGGWTLEETARTSTSVTFTTKSAGVATDPNFQVQLLLVGDYD